MEEEFVFHDEEQPQMPRLRHHSLELPAVSSLASLSTIAPSTPVLLNDDARMSTSAEFVVNGDDICDDHMDGPHKFLRRHSLDSYFVPQSTSRWSSNSVSHTDGEEGTAKEEKRRSAPRLPARTGRFADNGHEGVRVEIMTPGTTSHPSPPSLELRRSAETPADNCGDFTSGTAPKTKISSLVKKPGHVADALKKPERLSSIAELVSDEEDGGSDAVPSRQSSKSNVSVDSTARGPAKPVRFASENEVDGTESTSESFSDSFMLSMRENASFFFRQLDHSCRIHRSSRCRRHLLLHTRSINQDRDTLEVRQFQIEQSPPHSYCLSFHAGQ